jgi:glycosyltransferase involved in cell wall biosynthesis
MRTGRPRHVLLVFQPDVGGVPVYVRTLGQHLLQRGWRVTVIGPRGAEVRSELEAAGATYEACAMTRMPALRPDVAALRFVCRIARVIDADVVHAHASKAGLVAGLGARACRIPCVYTPHAWSFQMNVPAPVRMALTAVEVAGGRLVHRALITVSEQERDDAMQRRVASPDRIVTIPTGVPQRVLPSRDVARAELGCRGDDVVAAWIGRSGPQKQPDHLGRLAVALGSTARVIALGTGLAEDPAAAQALARAGVTLVAPQTPPTTVYAAADLLVQTSAWEGLPLTILEAMGSGVPVVAYGVGGVPELVLDGVTGLLVAPQDLDGLTASVRRLIADPQLRRRLGAAGVEHVGGRFTLEGMVSRVEGVYDRVMRYAVHDGVA